MRIWVIRNGLAMPVMYPVTSHRSRIAAPQRTTGKCPARCHFWLFGDQACKHLRCGPEFTAYVWDANAKDWIPSDNVNFHFVVP